MRRRLIRLALALPLVVGLGGLVGCAPGPPGLHTEVVMSGLDIPWDVNFLPSGSMVVTERPGRFKLRTAGGAVRQLSADLSDLFVGSETGLMGIGVDPAFASNHRIYSCQGYKNSTGRATDIRVIPWVLNDAETALARQRPLVMRMPISSGRHGGCRLRFTPDGHLWIGTGDAAVGTNAQNLTGLGGKVLRVNRFTGQGVSNNPFASSSNSNTRRIWSYGHRNVQGLALRPSDHRMWTVEQGTDRDDEVNRGITGNFGWDPRPGYNESRPMTDTVKFPQARVAAWRSGFPTLATSGATWLYGKGWRGYNGRLAVACLKAQRVLVMRSDAKGKVTIVTSIFVGVFGRIRTVQLGPRAHLFLTTSNGDGNDRVIEVTPTAMG